MNNDVSIIKDAIDNKNGQNIVEIRLEDAFTDYFVIATGNSRAQTQAIADEVELEMGKHGKQLFAMEGYNEGSWILMDFGDILVHVFLPEQRQYYNLEKLWQ